MATFSKTPFSIPTDEGKLYYLAGLIDADGCISIFKVTDKKGRNPGHYARVTVSNTNPAMIDWLIENLGGSVRVQWHAKNPEKNWRNRFDWQVYGTEALGLLEVLQDYLVAKGPQARLALRLKQYANPSNTVGLTSEIVEGRESLKQEMHKLNRRGLRAVS